MWSLKSLFEYDFAVFHKATTLTMNSSDELLPPTQVQDPYIQLLLQQDEHIHQVVQGILKCSMVDIRRTKVTEIPHILNMFTGPSLSKQKEALIEFLQLMPEYRTTETDDLYNRLLALKAELKRRGEITDLLIWAKLKYQNQNQG